MATREQYARVYHEVYDTEMTIGLELRDEDEYQLDLLNLQLKEWADGALLLNQTAKLRAVQQVEKAIKETWPDRAYFIEIEKGDKGVQVFQPYGLPRVAQPAGRIDDFGCWTGPGHAPGCAEKPRTARGCYCGGDHQ